MMLTCSSYGLGLIGLGIHGFRFGVDALSLGNGLGLASRFWGLGWFKF